MTAKFVSYLRVSTQQQGRSGLGLEAQRAAVVAYVAGRGELLREFVEVETGKGADALERRKELRLALETCRRAGAVLLIAKLDRLARNVHFVSGLIESGCDFIAVDMPNANKVMIQMHAVMSEYERDQISARTKAALAAAKARGVALGRKGMDNLRPNIEERQKAADAFALRLKGIVDGFQTSGLSHRAMAAELNAVGVSAPRGGKWTHGQVQRLLARLS
ncbi:recombinase family protein [Ramlibacter pallidus]|uniref:Recombinase family protein n=1 Tax=Ramlibacter pallidus TaxID=2780087 RepID=A0ABR9S9F0_9BURK|nr:recombinase family protein [Ramlibacter pallidus]MBE7370034.1 recombinase family protein [Ramlibacter pallidus]